MSPSRRYPVNKSNSSRKFRNASRKTKSANIRPPQRGGYRF